MKRPAVRRWITWWVAGAAASAGVLVAAGWLARSPAPSPAQAPTGTFALGMSKAAIVLRHRGARQAEIHAERVEVSADGRTATFAGSPRASLYVSGEPALMIAAGRVVLDRATGDARAAGGIVLTTPRGDVATASEARWIQTSGVIELRGGVVAQSSNATTRPAAPSSAAVSPVGGPPPTGRLRADRVRYDTRAQAIIASGNVSLVLDDLEIRADSLRLEQNSQIATAEGRVEIRRRDTRLEAPVVRYEVKTERAEASGGVTLTQKDTTVRARQMRFDMRADVTIAAGGVEVTHDGSTLTAAVLRHDARTGEVAAEGGVKFLRDGTTLTGRRLVANLEAKRADVRDEVILVRGSGPPPGGGERMAGEETTVAAARIVFQWDANEAEAEGRVVVKQRDRTAEADRMSYSERANRLLLTGNVVVEYLSAEQSVGEGRAGPSGEPSARRTPASPTRLECSRVIMKARGQDLEAEGPVRVIQKDRWASADRAAYAEAARRLLLIGNARIQEADGRRLQADRVTISLADETLEAEGNVETDFVIRPTPKGP